MINILLKIAKTPRQILEVTSVDRERNAVIAIGGKIRDNVKRLFRGSLAIRQIDTGSDNACEQEILALSNAFYDIERFGMHFVASPRHADMLLITGPVSRNMVTALKRTYEATPGPKIVVAVGDDAIDGGIYRGSYPVSDGVGTTVPVHYEIPGDPPSPMTILCHLLNILEKHESKQRK